MVWGSIKKKLNSMFSSESGVELGEDYVELEADLKNQPSKVLVKPFTLAKYDDIKGVLNAIREGNTISILNIGPLKEKDITELKRSIDKIKKTVEANEGDIAGFGENFLVVTPSFAKVERGTSEPTAEGQEPTVEGTEEL
jgi:SepF-like predicted cell division protein (DUF552 family)